MSWTDERIQILTKMWNDGSSASEIAKVLDTTRNAVIGKAHRLGISGRNATPAKKKAAAAAKPAKEKKTAKKEKEQEKKNIGILDLTERMCRWPHGHPEEKEFHFCGDDVIPGKPYCQEHNDMAYQAGSARGSK